MDLTTSYLGLHLRNPVVASASPFSHTLDGIRRLADGGVGAIVLHSLFEEELAEHAARRARLTAAGTESFAESLSYFPEYVHEDSGPRRYLNLIQRATHAVDVPVIASLNGASVGGWTESAKAIQEAGAVAIELNIFVVPGSDVPGREVDRHTLEVFERVKAMVDIPVAVKLSPYFSSIGEMAGRLDAAGADALVLFNRFMHPDVDPESLTVVPGIGLSSSAEARLPRMWIAMLRGRVRAHLAASTGVERSEDVAKYLLAGADVVMCASALLRHGPGYAAVLVEGLCAWMERKGFDALFQLRGMLAVSSDTDAAVKERAMYAAAMRAANANTEGPW